MPLTWLAEFVFKLSVAIITGLSVLFIAQITLGQAAGSALLALAAFGLAYEGLSRV